MGDEMVTSCGPMVPSDDEYDDVDLFELTPEQEQQTAKLRAFLIDGHIPCPEGHAVIGGKVVRLEGGAVAIAIERRRQVSAEGWTAEHDDDHDSGELLDAARCYLTHAMSHAPPDYPTFGWPWGDEDWKPSDDTVRDLVKSGALIAAEIDRLIRLDGTPPPPEPT